MKNHRNLIELLNLNYLKYANKTMSRGSKDLPAINCNITEYPDYIALSGEPGLYHKTEHTAVAFYEYDKEFDGKFGLFWAIYYDDEERLAEFKKRFKGVRYIIVPDCSELGDVHVIESEYRLFKARILALWFLFEIHAIVIPNITFPTKRSADFALDGYEDCSVVAFSTKGHINEPEEWERLRENVRLTVDKLSHLRTIIVYDTCGDESKCLDAFGYAVEHGIQLIVPDNTLRIQNQIRYYDRHPERR